MYRRYEQAEPLLVDCINIKKSFLGECHPSTLRSVELYNTFRIDYDEQEHNSLSNSINYHTTNISSTSSVTNDNNSKSLTIVTDDLDDYYDSNSGTTLVIGTMM